MQFKSIIVCAAFIFVAQYSLANVQHLSNESVHHENEVPLEICEEDKCLHLNTDNTFYKHWACEFTNTYLEWAKTFTEKCADVLKELEGHKDVSKHEKAKKELEHVIHLYEEAVQEDNKHKKFYLTYKMDQYTFQYVMHYTKSENKGGLVFELLRKHDIRDSIDEGRKIFGQFYQEFEEAFKKYIEHLNEGQKDEYANIVEWYNQLKMKTTLLEKSKQFRQFFLYFNNDLAKYHTKE